jgi:membrane protein
MAPSIIPARVSYSLNKIYEAFKGAAGAALTTPERVIPFFLQRMEEEQIRRTAAALSYSTSLAVVPALALVFAMLAAFPQFDDLRTRAQEFVVGNLVPDTGLRISETLNGFIEATGQLTTFGAIGLIVTAILLLLTIEAAFNHIFRVLRPRPLLLRLLVLWTVITVGPLLLGLSFSLSGYFSFTRLLSESSEGSTLGLILGSIMPALLTWLALTFIYVVVPNRRVRLRDALVGAGIAAILFAVLRYGFAQVVVGMTSYQAIYGAVAAVPVFLIWVFLIWMVVLAGAVISAALPDWRTAKAGIGAGPAGRLLLALEVLSQLSSVLRDGQGLRTERLAQSLAAPEPVLSSVLDDLRQYRFVVLSDDNRWMLTRDLTRTPLADLVHHFDLGLDIGASAFSRLRDSELGRRLDSHLKSAAESERTLLSVSLARVVAVADEAQDTHHRPPGSTSD